MNEGLVQAKPPTQPAAGPRLTVPVDPGSTLGRSGASPATAPGSPVTPQGGPEDGSEHGHPLAGWRKDPLGRMAALTGSLAVVAMALLVVTDVTARYFLNTPLGGAIEYVAFWLMVPTTAFGIVVAHRMGEHVDVTVLVDRLHERGQLWMRLIATAVFLLLAGVLTWFGALGAWERLAHGETAGASSVAVGPARWFVPVAMGALSLLLVADLARLLVRLRRTGAASLARVGGSVLPLMTVLTVVGCGWLLHQPLVPEAKGALSLGVMMVLLMARVPVAVGMAVAGLLGIWGLAGRMPLERSLIDVPFATSASWSLSVLPMFILMGLLLWRSGATVRLYDAARLWLGWLPGGLAVTTTAAGAGLAAASGSTVGITHALARIGLPEMLRSGYDRRVALGSVLMSGMAGQLIPPSVLLVVYAGLAQVPVGPQLLAGVVPGILLAGGICLALVVICSLRPSLAPSTWTRQPLAVRVRGLLAALPVPVLSSVVILGLLGGVFTATEAGAFGCLGSFVIAVCMLRRPAVVARAVGHALVGTVASVGQIMFLIIGTALLTRAVVLSGLPVLLVEQVNALGVGRVVFLVLLVLLYLVLGTFLDPIPTMLLTVPFLLPVLATLDIDLIWFGVFVVLLGELGMVTPPVGLLVFIVHKLAQNPSVNAGQEVRLSHTYAAAAWMVPVALAVVGVLIAFPGLVTVLEVG